MGSDQNWGQTRMTVPCPNAGGHRKARRSSVPSRAPNQALEPTPNSLRSCLAPAIGRGSARVDVIPNSEVSMLLLTNGVSLNCNGHGSPPSS